MSKKFIIVILIPTIIFLSAFIFVQVRREGGVPHSRQEVESKLDKCLTVDYEYISTNVIDDSERTRDETETVYYFKDKNGLLFKVVSSYIFWGGYEMVAQKESNCDYAEMWFMANQKDVDNVLAAYLHDNEYWLNDDENHYAKYWIRISNYDDLPKVADAVEAALTALPPLPIKKENYTIGEFDYSGIPTIGVLYNAEPKSNDDDNDVVLAWVDFYCEGDNTFDKEAFINEIEKGNVYESP